MKNFPYHLIAGSSLGVSYSSQNQIGDVLASRALGQADVQVYLNLANNNIVLMDHKHAFPEFGLPIDVSYVYNSKADTLSGQPNWRMPVKKLTTMPSRTPTLGKTAVLIEADGCQITFNQVGETGVYNGPGCGDGTPYIQFDEHVNMWTCYHPLTKTVEFFD